MGLDITAHSRLTPLGKHTDGWCEDEDHIEAFAYDTFPDSFRGIPVLATEHAGGSTFLHGGCWQRTDSGAEHHFQAGSYGRYNMWRDDLRRQFNPDTDPDGPFYELIWFVDNEGCIGPDAAKDLLEDFRLHFERYMPPAEHADYYLRKYAAWMKAFELAADGGLVRFW